MTVQNPWACIAEEAATLIFYVPPHGLAAVLADAAEVLGSDRSCVVARELTKVGMQRCNYCSCALFTSVVASDAMLNSGILQHSCITPSGQRRVYPHVIGGCS
jgi:16S rRNA C1402 (ribose-2'-O) methylase RsmI